MKGTKQLMFEIYYGSNSEEPRMFIAMPSGVATLVYEYLDTTFFDEEITIVPVQSDPISEEYKEIT